MSGKISRFEHFEILKDVNGELDKLGPGGMGTTYRAYDLHLRKKVALKIINDRTLADPSARRRFFNEARAAASIDHPNVARVIFLCPEDAVDCSFAMELVEGETLARRIVQQGPFAPGEALASLRPIADALTALGARGLVHRDIKPENIMMTRTPEGRADVKLIDFGLAKTLSPSSSIFESVHTGERFVGSAYFASPEQIRPNGNLDCRSDFYSLGVTLWHLVTGAPPFTGTVFEIQEAHVYREPPWEKIADQPQPFCDLLHSLLAKDPAGRPLNAAALLALWDRVIAALEISPTRLDLRPRPAAAADLDPSTINQVRKPSHPREAALPPPSGSLSADANSGTPVFIRRIPEGFAPEMQAALLGAARTARGVEHAGLLAVREISEKSISVEWPIAVTAAQVAAWHQCALPAEIAFAWLPQLAAAVDAAHTHGLAHLGVQPDRILVEYDPTAGPPGRSADLSRWKTARVRIDPLAAFDSPLVATARNIDAGGASRRAATCTTTRDYLALLARCVRDLMGGKTNGRLSTLDSLDERRRLLLLEAVNYRAASPSCAAWVETFLVGAARSTETALPAPVPGSARPLTESAAPTVPEAPRRLSTPDAGNVRRSWLRERYALVGVVGVLLLGWGFWSMRSASWQESSEVRTLLADAEAAREAGNLSRARDRVEAAGLLAPDNARLAAFRSRLDTSTTPPPAALHQAVALPHLSTPPPASATGPAGATVEVPFTNSLGMRFVPLSIVAGATNGSVVLFSVYETRVGDFQPFVTKGGWSPQPGQEASHPAVGVVPVDAEAFARWLAQRDHLPPGWEYRLPSDHEWNCAAGVGARDSANQPALNKADALKAGFPWGSNWPPPPRAANLADISLARSAIKMSWLPEYEDGFAYTAPVGSFPSNAAGLFDLVGNAAEWCKDSGSGGPVYILRGGSWATFDPSALLLGAHQWVEPDVRQPFNGFRLVLARTAAKSIKAQDDIRTRSHGNPGASAPPSLFVR